MAGIKWTNVVNKYTERFESEFSTCSKKAHFDCVPPHFTVIDGARSKWCYLLLLNAIVGILDFESFNLAARRKFNQQQILCDCIKAELADNGVDEEIYENTTLSATMDSNWSDLKVLRNFLERNAPYKSKEKYLGILDILLNHKVIETQGFDIGRCINTAINKILSSGNRKPSRRPQVIVTPVVKSKRVLLMKPPIAAATTLKDRKRIKLSTPAKKGASIQVEEAPQPVKKRSRRKSSDSPTITKPPLRSALPRRNSLPNVQDKTLSEDSTGYSDNRALAFDGDDIFHEHDEEIDLNAQPWELLETVPQTKNHSPHFHRPAASSMAMVAGSTASARTFGSPFFAGGGFGDPFAQPAALSLMTPEACKLMLPFPDCELQHPAVRMNPFPIDDGVEAEMEMDTALEEQQLNRADYDDSSY